MQLGSVGGVQGVAGFAEYWMALGIAADLLGMS